MDALEARLTEAGPLLQQVRRAIATTLVGQEPVVEQVLWAMLAGGHVLLEGPPGLGKTLLVRTLSAVLGLKSSRIQFTPDLMPSDVTGSQTLALDASGRFGGQLELQRGPVFTELLLADEINRATPKTQSALLEAMQERAVTLAGTRHALPPLFFVLATQNPIEMEGTYPLPEAQLDRFLLKVTVPFPGEDELVAILERTTGPAQATSDTSATGAQVLALQALCRDIAVAEPVYRYAARLVAASHPDSATASPLVRRALRYGAGVRAAQALILAAKACAVIESRPHLAFADLQRVAAPVLRHRLVRSFEGEAEGLTVAAVIAELLEQVPTRPARVEQELARA